jgi:hypothetical protein
MNQKESQEIVKINQEVITIEEPEDLISIAQKRFDIVKQLRIVALKITNHRDWVNQNDSPYLTHSGAEKVARLFGVKLSNIKTEKIWAEDSKGKYYIYKTTGEASLPGKYDSIEALGTCSQRDKFFAFKDGEWRDTAEIDETNIMKASYSNFVVNAITHLLGLRNLTWEELKEVEIDISKVKKVTYGEEKKKNTGLKTISKKSLELRKKIKQMALELAGGNEEEANIFIKQASMFKVTDKNGNEQEKFASKIEDLNTDRWIEVTYGRMKEMYKKAFPQSSLFAEEGQNDSGKS